MRIQEHHSIFGGYEFILMHRAELWTDIEAILVAVDGVMRRPQELRTHAVKTQFSIEDISAKALLELGERGWALQQRGVSEVMSAMKERVVVEFGGKLFVHVRAAEAEQPLDPARIQD